MTASIYERDDHAIPAPVSCVRCGRRAYFAREDMRRFVMRASELESRCVGCGYETSGCPCPEARAT